MAIWQKTFHIQPKTFIDKNIKSILFDEHGEFDDEVLWDTLQMNINQSNALLNVLPEYKSWSNDIRQFGELEHHCIEVIHEKEIIKSISIRINFCSQYQFIFARLLPIIKSKDWVLLDSDFEIIIKDIHQLKSIIESSQEKKNYLNIKKMTDT